MRLKLFAEEFVVCKTTNFPQEINEPIWSFTVREDELSLLCKKDCVPADVFIKESGFRAFSIEGPIEFGAIGILAKISKILADERISIFVISTYDTDIFLVKEINLGKAIDALVQNGYEIYD